MRYNNNIKSKRFLAKLLVYSFIMFLPFVVFYWQVPFVANQTLGNDYVAFPIQQQMELQYSLKHGSFPLYVPGFAGGQSMAALTLGQVFHPISHLASVLPGYWEGNALQWNTLLRLLSLGLVHLGLFILLVRLGLGRILSFIISFITVYNLRMLDLFRYGASLENYTGYLFLCLAVAFYYIKPTRFPGPVSIIASTYLLVCGGHPQMMYLGLLGAGIGAIAIPFVMSKISSEIKVDRQRLIKYFTTVGLCMFCGILLASAYIIPFYFDFILTNAQRVGQEYQFSLEYSSTLSGMLNSFLAPLQSEVQGAFGSSPLIILIVLIPLLYAFRVKVPVAVTTLWGVLLVIFLCGLGNATPLHYYFWKYFPLAQSFRAPGRMSMLFPFLFLLLLAWLFRRTDEKIKPSYGFLALTAVPLFVLYNWLLVKYLPKPKFCMPMHIKPYPQWVDSLVLWVGFFSLVLLLLHSFYIKKKKTTPGFGLIKSFCGCFTEKGQFFQKEPLAAEGKKWSTAVGFLLALAIILQVTIEFRYATWVVKKFSQPTLANMDRQKKRALTFRGDPGHGMESVAVFKQKKQSILEPVLAKFYRKYKYVPDQTKAYRFLRKENVSDTIVVESALPSEARPPGDFKDTYKDLKKEDRIQLKENDFNRVLFSVDAQAPGFFALSFPYSNRWRVTVDGNSTRIYRGNGYLQAVYLEAGAHEIEFRYWSKAAFIGMLVSGLTFLLMGNYFAFFVFAGKWRVITLVVSLLVPVGLFLAWYSGLYNGDNLGTQYTWSSKRFPPVNNLAYAKKTYMSYGRWLFYSGLGVDGEKHKPFITGRLGKGWWQVDLGSPHPLGEIVIYDGPFLGRKNLPLRILASINGKDFVLLKKVENRGQDRPWRIPMSGEITRIVRLKSSTKKLFSFREVEIYPLTTVNQTGKKHPLVQLVRSEPITAVVLKKITLLNHAVEKGDEHTVRALLEKEINTSREIKKILMFEALNKAIEGKHTTIVKILAENGADVRAADLKGSTPLMKAVKNGYRDMAAILKDYGAKLSPCAMDIDPQKIIEFFTHKKIISPGDKEITVWNKKGSTVQDISPALVTFGKWGKFKIDSIKDIETNVIRVRIIEPNNEGIRRLHLGYENSRKGLDIGMAEGKYITFIVRLAISPHLVNRENYIAVLDYNKDGNCEAKKTFFTSHQWHTYVVSKKVRPGNRRLLLMFRFNSRSSEDELKIKDAKIIISERAL